MCSELGLEHARSIAALDRCCKTKICDFEGVIFVKKKIFRLEITMGYSLTVHEIQTIKKLLKVVPSGSFTQAATEGNKIEERASSDKLEADELDILSSLLRIRLLTFTDLNKSHDIVVLELCESRDFGLD